MTTPEPVFALCNQLRHLAQQVEEAQRAPGRRSSAHGKLAYVGVVQETQASLQALTPAFQALLPDSWTPKTWKLQLTPSGKKLKIVHRFPNALDGFDFTPTLVAQYLGWLLGLAALAKTPHPEFPTAAHPQSYLFVFPHHLVLDAKGVSPYDAYATWVLQKGKFPAQALVERGQSHRDLLALAYTRAATVPTLTVSLLPSLWADLCAQPFLQAPHPVLEAGRATDFSTLFGRYTSALPASFDRQYPAKLAAMMATLTTTLETLNAVVAQTRPRSGPLQPWLVVDAHNQARRVEAWDARSALLVDALALVLDANPFDLYDRQTGPVQALTHGHLLSLEDP
jgi:hypothetical protein